MRTSVSSLLPVAVVAALSTACSSGTVVYRSVPAPAPAPAPAPRVTPLEITVVRAESGRLLLQTNRAAYVALFEIVPGRGTALVYPSSVRQRGTMLGGLTWVPVWWAVQPAPSRRIYVDDGRPERYVYALVSDRPLRISDYSYDTDYLQRVLGAEAYRGSNPYATLRALSRQFVPAMTDEHWGEDLYALAAPAARVTYRIARVYCTDGTVFEVREDMAHRAWCPPRRRGAVGSAPTGADAPDSVVSSGGRPVARRPFDPGDRQPPFRVPVPTTAPASAPAQTEEPRDRDDRGRDKDRPKDQDKDKPKDQDKDKDHDDNGRRSHGDPRNADPRGRGNGAGSGNQPRTEPQPLPEIKLQGQPTPPPDVKPAEKAKPDKEEKVEKVEKPDPTPPPQAEPKPEPRPEPKAEPKPEPKPEPRAEPKAENKPSAIEKLLNKRGPKDKKGEPARPDSSSKPD